jgi:hypothetical protein
MCVPLQGCPKSECRLTYVRMQWAHWTNCVLCPLLAVSCSDAGLALFTLTVSSPWMYYKCCTFTAFRASTSKMAHLRVSQDTLWNFLVRNFLIDGLTVWSILWPPVGPDFNSTSFFLLGRCNQCGLYEYIFETWMVGKWYATARMAKSEYRLDICRITNGSRIKIN